MNRSHKKNSAVLLSTPFGSEQDAIFMAQALDYARCALAQNEVPIGAIVVDGAGRVIGSGFNETETVHTQAAHAEMRAIVAAGTTLSDWRLTNCWLYVTLEPCFMCMGLIYLSRFAGVVYGAPSPLFGGQLDSSRMVSIYNVNALTVLSGVCQQEASDMLKDFFRKKRSGHGSR